MKKHFVILLIIISLVAQMFPSITFAAWQLNQTIVLRNKDAWKTFNVLDSNAPIMYVCRNLQPHGLISNFLRFEFIRKEKDHDEIEVHWGTWDAINFEVRVSNGATPLLRSPIPKWTQSPKNITFIADGKQLSIQMDGKTTVVPNIKAATGFINISSMTGDIDVYHWVEE